MLIDQCMNLIIFIGIISFYSYHLYFLKWTSSSELEK